MKKKRFLALMIDIIILLLIFKTISLLFVNPYQVELTTLSERFINNEIGYSEFLYGYININYYIAKNNVVINIIQMVIMTIYFVLIPYINNGSTIGKILFKIKVDKQDGKLKITDLLIRSFIINGNLYLLILLILLPFVNSLLYFTIENILGIMQIIVVIISGFMVLYKKDNLGLHDILTKTVVKER